MTVSTHTRQNTKPGWMESFTNTANRLNKNMFDRLLDTHDRRPKLLSDIYIKYDQQTKYTFTIDVCLIVLEFHQNYNPNKAFLPIYMIR